MLEWLDDTSAEVMRGALEFLKHLPHTGHMATKTQPKKNQAASRKATPPATKKKSVKK